MRYLHTLTERLEQQRQPYLLITEQGRLKNGLKQRKMRLKYGELVDALALIHPT